MSRDLTEAPVQSLIRKMALPASIGFFFNTMYNVVDTHFGGQISTTALAAMSLCFPVFFLIIIRFWHVRTYHCPARQHHRRRRP
jgi:Na+-driven multidrug efflux pump